MDKTLLLRAAVSGGDALLCLNGMVLCKISSGAEVLLPVHEFIQSGANRVQVFCLSAAHLDYKTQLSIELQKDRGITTLVEPQVLFKFSETEQRGGYLEKNHLLDVRVDLPVSFPRWRYLDVMQSSNHSDDHQKIHGFFLNLLNLLQAQNIAGLQPYFSVRNREVAAAYGFEMQQVHSNFQTHLHRLSTQAVLSDSVWNPDSWYLHTVHGSSVYALLNNLHEPLLQFQMKGNGTTLQWPMHVGVLGGEVFVLR